MVEKETFIIYMISTSISIITICIILINTIKRQNEILNLIERRK